MLIKGITDEDFINYKLPSMFIATATCSFKCDRECGRPVCQNSELAKQPNIEISALDIATRYLANPITHAVVIGGLEPFDQINDIFNIIGDIRTEDLEIDKILLPDGSWYHPWFGDRDHPKAKDPVIIYTGYTREELDKMIYDSKDCDEAPNNLEEWCGFGNIIIKFGRYIPGHKPHFDPVLGVYLASDNQYAERIS